MKRVSAAQAKAHLSQLMAEVAYGGERVIIERHGKPYVALVRVNDLDGTHYPTSPNPKGALALVGLFGDIPDEEIDQMVKDIYEAREGDMGRPVDLSD